MGLEDEFANICELATPINDVHSVINGNSDFYVCDVILGLKKCDKRYNKRACEHYHNHYEVEFYKKMRG